MKILILYATKTGTVKKCASLLATHFGVDNCTLIDIKDERNSLSDYDALIMGTPVRMGKIDKRLSSFIAKNKETLLNMPLGIFTCNGFLAQAGEAFANNFCEDIIEHAITMDTFGGELSEENAHGIDKLLTKIIIKGAASSPDMQFSNSILYSNIASFAMEIKNYLSEKIG